MKKIIIALAASVAVFAPSQANAMTCGSALDTLFVDLERSITILEGIDIANITPQNMKDLTNPELVKFDQGAMTFIDKNCKDSPALARYRQRSLEMSKRLQAIMREATKNPMLFYTIYQ